MIQVVKTDLLQAERDIESYVKRISYIQDMDYDTTLSLVVEIDMTELNRFIRDDVPVRFWHYEHKQLFMIMFGNVYAIDFDREVALERINHMLKIFRNKLALHY